MSDMTFQLADLAGSERTSLQHLLMLVALQRNEDAIRNSPIVLSEGTIRGNIHEDSKGIAQLSEQFVKFLEVLARSRCVRFPLQCNCDEVSGAHIRIVVRRAERLGRSCGKEGRFGAEDLRETS